MHKKVCNNFSTIFFYAKIPSTIILFNLNILFKLNLKNF